MTKIIALCNQKGGVGKTTTCINVATCLAMAGHKVLLIDMDPQGNTTSGIGVEKREIKQSIYDVLLDHADIFDVIQPTEVPNLDIAPSHIALSGAEIELVDMDRREYRLKTIVNRIITVSSTVSSDITTDSTKSYEYIFIDCPPSLGLLTLNALTCANSVLIPIQCEYYALEGLGQLLTTINLVKANLNPLLEIEGIVLTMADYRTNLTAQVIDEARSFFKEKVTDTVIPRNVRLSEAPSFGQSIFQYDKYSAGAQKYMELAQEIAGENLMDILLNNKKEEALNGEEGIRQRTVRADSNSGSLQPDATGDRGNSQPGKSSIPEDQLDQAEPDPTTV